MVGSTESHIDGHNGLGLMAGSFIYSSSQVFGMEGLGLLVSMYMGTYERMLDLSFPM